LGGASECLVSGEDDLPLLEFLLVDLRLFEMEGEGGVIGLAFLFHHQLLMRTVAISSNHFGTRHVAFVEKRGLHPSTIALGFSQLEGLLSVLLYISQ
jgi:hypothetical protein